MSDEAKTRLRLALGKMLRILGAGVLLNGARMGLPFGRYPFTGVRSRGRTP